MTGIGPFIWNHPILLVGSTWAPLLLQLAFPFVLFFGRPLARRVALIAAMSFHLGILLLMGLSTFAIVMIATELLLLSNEDYKALSRPFVGILRPRDPPTPDSV